MRKHLLLLFSLFGFCLNAQVLSVTPDPIILEVPGDVVDKKIDMIVKNTSGSDVDFWWSIDRGSCPDEWKFYLCDVNLCYTPSVTSCPCNKENTLAPNEEGTLMMHIIPNGVTGMGVITLKLTDACDGKSSSGSTSIVELPITFNVGTTSTKFSEINNDISIFPNPTYDQIKLKEDENVSELVIYNIVGKKLMRLKHSKGQSHDVSELDKGIYLVRLINKKNNVLKVLRLTKK
ncbi:MAG: T9SS type A sorting domain-containing protein [Saprospiraceae bacterium]|nr:T9SS type A sorting domain-containing protein [Bacteroidia bacterium]NNE13705.1 T9SS type A sorting domain-containing protein [Saprospiraceae bacterium]NNL90976.1 T9SS type A sorting domain-containing protein [Saprospiraceae bacterium]